VPCSAWLRRVLEASSSERPCGFGSVALLLGHRRGQGELPVYQRVELEGASSCLSYQRCTDWETPHIRWHVKLPEMFSGVMWNVPEVEIRGFTVFKPPSEEGEGLWRRPKAFAQVPSSASSKSAACTYRGDEGWLQGSLREYCPSAGYTADMLACKLHRHPTHVGVVPEP
jgi:hypothetical protein